jgi:hypothetical protein
MATVNDNYVIQHTHHKVYPIPKIRYYIHTDTLQPKIVKYLTT